MPNEIKKTNSIISKLMNFPAQKNNDLPSGIIWIQSQKTGDKAQVRYLEDAKFYIIFWSVLRERDNKYGLFDQKSKSVLIKRYGVI